MSPESSHPGAPQRRWLSFLCLLGVAALAVSLAGSGWMMRLNTGPPSAAGGTSNSADVCCLGYVDKEEGVSYPYPVNAGRVVKILAKEGKPVKEGEVLFRLDDQAPRNAVQQAEQALATAKLAVRRAGNDLVEHDRAKEAQEAAIAVAEKVVTEAEPSLKLLQKLLKSGGTEPEAVQKAEAVLHIARDNVEVEKKKLRVIEAKRANLELAREVAQANIKEKQLLLDRANLALDECEVKAPADGSVLRLNLQVGDLLSAEPKSQPLIFCPDGPRIVRAEIEQEWTDRVEKGQRVTFQDDTTNEDGYKWGGEIDRVGDWMAHRRSILPDPGQMHDVRTLECIVKIDPNQKPLRIGQRVRLSLKK
jgi:multidrug resistance efflux pump